MNCSLQEGGSGMNANTDRTLSPEERRRGAAAILALAVRRILQDDRNSKVQGTNDSNRVAFSSEKRLSVSLVPDTSGTAACPGETALRAVRCILARQLSQQTHVWRSTFSPLIALSFLTCAITTAQPRLWASEMSPSARWKLRPVVQRRKTGLQNSRHSAKP